MPHRTRQPSPASQVRSGEPHFISKEGSRVKVAVIPTDEELEIARISVEIAEKQA